MDLNLYIEDLSLSQLKDLDIKCANCSFWFDNRKANFIEEFYRSSNIWDLIKSKIFERRNKNNKEKKIFGFKKYGGRIKAAFNGKECVGIILSGRYYLFPKLKSFNIYPPDNDCEFLGCIYVVPQYRDIGVDKRLLMGLEKDLMEEKVKSIETVGKRLNDDIDEYEYQNSPLIPVKFLIKNGFYIRKNDEFFPLMRLDLKSIRKVHIEDRLVIDNIPLKNEVRSPVIIEKN